MQNKAKTDAQATTRAFDPALDFPRATVRFRYLIMSQHRTGSSLICSALKNSGVAGIPLEYFHADHLGRLTQPLTADIVAGYYRDVQERRTSPNGVFGMKIHFDQFRRLFVSGNSVTQSGIRFLTSFDRTLLVSRNDKIAQAISHMLAERTAVWNSGRRRDEGSQSLKLEKTDLPVVLRYLSAAVADHLAWERIVAALSLKPMIVTYEELVRSPDSELRRIMEHLGLPPLKIAPSTVRLSRDGHREARTTFLEHLGANQTGEHLSSGNPTHARSSQVSSKN